MIKLQKLNAQKHKNNYLDVSRKTHEIHEKKAGPC